MYEAVVSFLEDLGLSPKDWTKTVAGITQEVVKSAAWFTKPSIEELSNHAPELSFFPPTNVTYLGAFSAAVMTWFVLTGREYSHHGVSIEKPKKGRTKSEIKHAVPKKTQAKKQKKYDEKLKEKTVLVERDHSRKNQGRDSRSSMKSRTAKISGTKINEGNSQNTLLDDAGTITESEEMDQYRSFSGSSSRTEIEILQNKADLTRPQEETNGQKGGTGQTVNPQTLESTSAGSARTLGQQSSSLNGKYPLFARSYF